MEFIKLTFLYIKKNFLILFLYAIIPTIFVGIILNPFSLFEFLVKYPTLVVTNLGSLLGIMFNASIWNIILVLLGVLIICMFASMSLGQIENHMRSGKIKLKSSVALLNNNFIVVAINVVVLFLLMLLFEFIYCSFLCLIHLIFSGLNSTPNLFTIILAIILASIVFILFIQIASMLLLNIPNMTINGYPVKQAFINSIKLLEKKNFKFMFSLLLPFIIIIPLVCLLKGKLIMIANVVGIFMLFMYIPPLIMTSYFELSNTQRYDNRKYFNY